jgi:hypothetical protein
MTILFDFSCCCHNKTVQQAIIPVITALQMSLAYLMLNFAAQKRKGIRRLCKNLIPT